MKIRNGLKIILQGIQSNPNWIVFLIGLLFLMVLETIFSPLAIDNVYFQRWSSEDMMQTAPIVALRDEPFTSLYYLHIQPPALDAVRALLAQRYRSLDRIELVHAVDRDIYILWAILYALMGTIIFQWLSKLMTALPAFFASIIFYLHPAAILYATFLESTFLFALGILWSYYELWELQRNPVGRSVIPVSLSFLLIFLTRSVIQWPALFVYLLSLWLIKVPGKKILLFFLISGALVTVYTTRQLSLFQIPYTSSLAGGNCFHGLGEFSTYAGYGVDQITIRPSHITAKVLNEEYKSTGAENLNHFKHLQYHRAILDKCYERLLSQPWQETGLAFLGNFVIYIQPSSHFTTPHIIADRLPWRLVYNTIFSNLVLIFLVAASIFLWLKFTPKWKYSSGLGMLLPAIYIFLMTVLFERGENMRYKFFLEPVFYVFLAVQLFRLFQYFRLNKR